MKKTSFVSYLVGIVLFGALASVSGYGDDVNINVVLHGTSGDTNFVVSAPVGEPYSFLMPFGEGEVPAKLTCLPEKAPSFGGNYYGLFVGINDYLELPSLDACVNDSMMMLALFCTNFYKGPIPPKNCRWLTDDKATKSAISGSIQEMANALEPGDTFVYFQSSHGGDNPLSLCTYDGFYLATELAEDLALFKDGVKVAVILDSCFSGGMIPEEGAMAKAVMKEYKRVKAAKAGLSSLASIKEDVCFLTASQANEYSWTAGDGFSLFSELIYDYGCLANADVNEDMYITMGELFNGAVGAMKILKTKGQHPSIYNEDVANGIYATRVIDYTATGWLAPIDGQLYYMMKSVPDPLYIEVWAEKADSKEVPLTTKNLSLNFNLAKGTELLGVPTKISGTFEMPFSGIMEVPNELLGPVVINGHWYGYAVYNSLKGNKLVYTVVDRDWNKVGSFTGAVNMKKGIMTLKYKLKAPSEHCIDGFAKQNGQQPLGIYMNLYSSCLTDLRAGTVSYKEGKKLTVKLTKEKKR